MNTPYSVIVIGGGAAGMLAAQNASACGASVLLLEKNKKLGIKILISGGGKCNITNGSTIQTMLDQFEKNESRFLKYSFHAFTNTVLLNLLRDHGVETYTRENGKVFPVSHNADDVVRALREMLDEAGAAIRLNAPVTAVTKNPNGIFSVTAGGEVLRASTVIVATGGTSYRKTGTTGDGYLWLRTMGHTIVPLRPALAPIVVTPVPPHRWQGTPIRDARLTAQCGNETVAEWRGDMLFTHFGISGPAALEISKKTFVAFEQGKLVTLQVDFYPELSLEQLEEKVMESIASNVNRSIASLVDQLIPQKMTEYLLLRTELDESTKLHQLKKDRRRALVRILKRCPIGAVSDIPLDRGEVTAGGVALNEVLPMTMESKIVPGLFLCGEILDIAGPVGGYNLQAAFSTGYVAGNAAAQRALTTKG